MTRYKHNNRINTLVRILLISAILIGFGLILEHSNHHDNDHGTCEICLLVSGLFVMAVFVLIIFTGHIDRIFIVFQTFSTIPIRDFRIIRAPPKISFSVNQ